jgi:hypothetical protein
VAKWVFVLLTVMTIGRSLIHIFLPDGGASSIATIPLDDFTQDGSDAVIHIFAQWGLSQLLFGLMYVIVLWGLSKKVVTLERSEGSFRLIRRFFTSFRMTFLCFLDSPSWTCLLSLSIQEDYCWH